jgi:hypothetical protein
MEANGERYAFFFAPEGMTPVYLFPAGTKIIAVNEWTTESGGFVKVNVSGNLPEFTAIQGSARVNFVTLNHEQSLQFSVEEYAGRKAAVICDGLLLADRDSMRIEHCVNTVSVSVFPDNALPMNTARLMGRQGVFTEYRLETLPVTPDIKFVQTGPTRYVAYIPQWDASSVKELLLRINYYGDIGSAFIDGDMISDNFYNGAAWEIGLREFSDRLKDNPLTIYITPLKKDSSVNVESSMAGRREETGALKGVVESVSVKAVYQWTL